MHCSPLRFRLAPYCALFALLGLVNGLAPDVSASIKFPNANNRTADPAQASALIQSVTGLSPVFGSDGAFFAIASLPSDQREGNYLFQLMGNDGGSGGNRIRIGLYGKGAGITSARNKLHTRVEGTTLYTPVVTEEKFLVVLYRSGSVSGIDWYSLVDGTKYAGDTATGATIAHLSSIGPNWWVGGYGSGTPVLGSGTFWHGEIECVGYVNGAVGDSVWSSIALTGDVVNSLGAANLKWYRDLHSPASSFDAPAEATADATPAMTLWGAPLAQGEDFWPEDDAPAPAASVKFPEDNNVTSNSAYATALIQPVTNLSPVYGSDAAFFAIARLPVDKRGKNELFGLMGNDGGSGGNRIRIGLYGSESGVTSNQNKLHARVEGTNLYTPEVTEDAFLVVIHRSGDNKGIDWYSLKDGTKHAGGTATGATIAHLSSIGPNWRVGGIGSGSPTLGSGSSWPGEIDCVGYVTGAVSDSTWSSIALGAEIVPSLGVANLKWYRELDTPATSYTAPAGATADLTPPMTLWGATLRPGSDFLRQEAARYLLVDELSDGWVYGLTRGQTSKAIPVGGTSGGLSGTVQVRVLNAATRAVVVDWTNVGTISANQWSGTLTVPKGGWYVVEARCGGLAAAQQDEFGVGWKIVQLGQSQTSIYLNSNVGLGSVNPLYHYSMSYLTNDSGRMSLRRLSMIPRSDGLSYFLNQMRVFDPSTPVMVIDEAVNGTGAVDLVTDAQSGRSWTPFQEKLDTYGNDVSVVVRNWGTNDMTSNMFEVLDALVSRTGPRAGDHSLDEALQPGYTFAVSPLTRHVGGGSYEGNANQARSDETAWAWQHSHTVGPAVSDFVISVEGGPHQDGNQLMANCVFGVRQAVAVARALDLDASTNPSFSGTATRSGNEISLGVTLPNGGNLSSPTPGNLLSFVVNESGTWTSVGFNARIVGSSVVLTRSTGNWAAGTQVRYLQNLATRADGDSASELAIVNSALYETWAPDVMGLGLPLMGSTITGLWTPGFTITAP